MALLQYRLDHYGKYFDIKPSFKTKESERELREQAIQSMKSDYAYYVKRVKEMAEQAAKEKAIAIAGLNTSKVVKSLYQDIELSYSDHYRPRYTPDANGNFSPADISLQMYGPDGAGSLYATGCRVKMLTTVWQNKEPDQAPWFNPASGMAVSCYINSFSQSLQEGFKTILMTEIARETVVHPVTSILSKKVVQVLGMNPYTPGQFKNFWVEEEWVVSFDDGTLKTKQDIYNALQAKWKSMAKTKQ